MPVKVDIVVISSPEKFKTVNELMEYVGHKKNIGGTAGLARR